MSDKKLKEKDVVRFNVNLSKEAYDALVRLQRMSNKSSLAETLRDALKLYLVVEEGREDGKELYLIGQDKDRERIIGP
jgi:hypothetical protein